MHDPEMDGIDHINIYSKGNTALGRQLTNFAPAGFDHPQHGRFESVEGYWYWLSTGMKHDQLRTLYGFQAKKRGKEFPKIHVDNFEKEIQKAIYLKITQSKIIMYGFIRSTLPFQHYYSYGGKVVEVKEYEWIVDIHEKLRTHLRGKYVAK